MANIEGLIEHINKNYRDRLKVLAAIEEIRQHHLVRDNAIFYLDSDGELKGKVLENNNLSSADLLQVRGRVAKLSPIISNYNQTYKKLRKIITELPQNKALYILKECAKESAKLYDEINNVLVEDLKQHNKLPEDFEGRIDLNRLKNTPRARKVTFTVLQQYFDYETNFYKQFEEELNNSKLK